MKKYYYDEHESTYQEMKRNNILAWDEYHEPTRYSYENFMMRPFLEKALEYINPKTSSKYALEYGCGTGAGANFLAQRGFKIDAIDISPTAISIAQEMGKDQDIHYIVQDLLELSSLTKQYDLILDNYCLQSIVTDHDRNKLFAIVQSGLKESGYYIFSTAIYNQTRIYGDGSYYEDETGIVYDKVSNNFEYEGTVLIDGQYWIPKRRHHKREKLKEELISAGFHILVQEDGNIICQKMRNTNVIYI